MHPNASMKYNRRYKDFNEFCEYIKTPEEVMNWYKVNKIKWNKPVETGEYNKKPMCWPDDIIRDKIGNCFDHAVFMHYFCKKYNIENYIVRCVRYKALRVNSKYYFAHHFVCVLKSDIGWVIFDYNSSYENTPRAIRAEQTSVLRGPFETKEDAGEEYTKEFNERLEKFYNDNLFDWKYRDRTRSQSIFLNDNVMRMLDKLYGEHSFTQEDFYYMMRHEMGDTKYEGEYYESINVLDYIGNKLILGLDKVQNFREEGDVMLESVNKGGVIVHPRDIDWDKDIIPIDYNKKRKPPEERRPKHSIIPKELYEKYADELEEYRKWEERSRKEHERS